MSKKKFSALLITICLQGIFHLHATNISLQKNLGNLVANLSKGMYKKALLVSPHITYLSPLVKAADKGTQITLISQNKNPDRELLQHPNISCLQARVHDKFYCTQHKFDCNHLECREDYWSCYLGSANLSSRALRHNRELVLRVDNASSVPGLAQHTQTLVNRGMIPENSGIPSETFENNFSDLVTEPVSQSLKEAEGAQEHPLLCEARPILLSSFDTSDIVTLVSKYIQINHMIHEYRISSMTLNHPEFIRRLRLAALVGDSRIKLIVDSEWAKKALLSQGEFFKLFESSQKVGSNIEIRAANKKVVSGCHHAKCLIRKPLHPKGERGVSIVGSANMTVQAQKDSNYALAIPHTLEQKIITNELEETFDTWWNSSRELG